MTIYNDTKIKISNALRAIEELGEADFPQDSGRLTLRSLKTVFDDLSKKLDRSLRLSDETSRNRTIATFASDVNLKLLQVLPVLGFILRSINVRNAFEFLDPLQTLASSVLQGKSNLILSSEWDYIPFAWPQNLDDLSSFVLIGLPATEADTALLIPLAGHELGHAIWRNRRLEASVLATLQHHVQTLYDDARFKDEFSRAYSNYDPSDLIFRDQRTDSMALCVDLALHRAQELFCDMFAYGLFGAAYA